jgi:hypothetical protein
MGGSRLIFAKAAISCIRTFSSPDAYIADVLQGGKSILKSGLVVTRGSTEPIQIIVNPAGAVIQGRVQNGSQASIYLYSRSTNANNFRGERTLKAGEFALTGVAPGEYMIFAFPLHGPDTLDPDFLIKYESQGTPITIKDETPVTITLPLSRP